MRNVVDFVTDDGVTISVEAVPVRHVGVVGVSRDPDAPVEKKNLDTIVTRIQKVAEAVSKQLRKLSESKMMPDETRVEFGVSVSVDANILVAKGNGESSFKVTMVWREGK